MARVPTVEEIGVLKPLEKVFPKHLSNLEDMIEAVGVIKKPIIADIQSGTILDGSHRYAYLMKKGYKKAPVIWVDYSDPDISTGIHMSKDEVINRTELLPPRTTRHRFPFVKDDYETPLAALDKGEERDISYLLDDVSVEFEVEHNKKFLAEVKETQSYIEMQLGLMKPAAVFVGKFNPPHIGHALTVLKLKENYNLEICVTNDTTAQGFTQDEIAEEMRGFGITVSKLPSRLVDCTHNPFEGKIVLTGNPDVIEWAKSVGAEHKFVERSGIISSARMR